MVEAQFTRPHHLSGLELVSAQYRGRAFPTHSHECLVIGTVVAGAEALFVGGRTHVVAAGDVLQLAPGEPHANHTLGDDLLHYRVFYISADILRQHGADKVATGFANTVSRNADLGRTLAQLHQMLATPQLDRFAQETAMAKLVAIVQPNQRGIGDETVVAFDGMSQTRSFIEENCAQNIGLTELASIAGLSTFRLAHLFKRRFGLSPIAYRNQCRVHAGRRKLLAGQPIADIAAELGFADQSHFTRHFQRIMGASPRRYRQQ